MEIYSNGTLFILGFHGLVLSFLVVLYKHILGFDHLNAIIAVVLSLITIMLLYYPLIWTMKHAPILVGKNKMKSLC